MHGDENALAPWTGNHKGCPYEGFVVAYFQRNGGWGIIPERVHSIDVVRHDYELKPSFTAITITTTTNAIKARSRTKKTASGMNKAAMARPVEKLLFA